MDFLAQFVAQVIPLFFRFLGDIVLNLLGLSGSGISSLF